MKLSEVAQAWHSVGNGLPGNLYQQIAADLAQLPKDDKVDNFLTYLYRLDHGEKSLAAKQRLIDNANKKAGQELLKIRILLKGRIAEVQKLRKDMNAAMNAVVKAGQDFLGDERPEKGQALAKKVQVLNLLCVQVENRVFLTAAAQIATAAGKIVSARKNSKSDQPRSMSEFYGSVEKRKGKLLVAIRECEQMKNGL